MYEQTKYCISTLKSCDQGGGVDQVLSMRRLAATMRGGQRCVWSLWAECKRVLVLILEVPVLIFKFVSGCGLWPFSHTERLPLSKKNATGCPPLLLSWCGWGDGLWASIGFEWGRWMWMLRGGKRAWWGWVSGWVLWKSASLTAESSHPADLRCLASTVLLGEHCRPGLTASRSLGVLGPLRWGVGRGGGWGSVLYRCSSSPLSSFFGQKVLFHY